MTTSAFDAWVERARSVPIEKEIARRGIKLNGKTDQCGPCPACGGTDRFSINTKKQVWNCRGCGCGGDTIKLVQHLDRVDFIAACTTLTGEAPPSKPNGKAKPNGMNRARGTTQKIIAAEYLYENLDGVVAFVVERIEFKNANGSFVLKSGKRKKTFRQRRPDPDKPGKWIWNVDGVPALIYRALQVTEAILLGQTIFVVEGEGKAELLWSWNIPTTCCVQGAKAWTPEHAKFLRGADDVVILPDHDTSGTTYANAVAELLQGIAAAVRVLQLPNLPPKGDIIDWATAGGTVEQLHELIQRDAKPWATPSPSGATAPPPPPSVASPPSTGQPQIILQGGKLPEIVSAFERVLIDSKYEIYQRGDLIVRPVMSVEVEDKSGETKSEWRLLPATALRLVDVATAHAQFLRLDKRSQKYQNVDAPKRVADTYLARAGHWELPPLTGISYTPFLRRDGSICEQPGYDQQTGILFKPGKTNFPPIPVEPTKADAEAALKELTEPIKTFPFVTDADRSVALSAILTALDRRAMISAPLHGYTAPAAGTGKSKLVDFAATIATGGTLPVTSQGRTEEELEKRLGASLLAGDVMISIDNCELRLESSFLCQILTQERVNVRVLGLSKNVEVPANVTVSATGNNLAIAGDLTRRSLLCSLDAKCERPELRKFKLDVIKFARENRARLVMAGLTILRAYHVSGDCIEVDSLGGFEEWSQRIREPLLWLSRTDPCDTIEKVRSGDPGRDALATVIAQWSTHLEVSQSYTLREIISSASATILGSSVLKRPEFHAALLAIAANTSGNLIDNIRLGRWLKKVEGRVVDTMCLRPRGSRDGYPLWFLGPP